MRIDQSLPYFNNIPQNLPERNPAASGSTGAGGLYYGPVVVDISPQARAALARDNASGVDKTSEVFGIEGCQTCKNRKYVDKSNDPSVSFQSPTHISPGQAASAVMSHEREHVTNEQARAEREDRRVISQTVSLSTSVCPECGRIYVSGGVTRTLTASDNSNIPQEENSEQNQA
ncbi:MAG: hypothetical protein FWG99_06890 [Treponema sp.]|nr:hypothetical protein [Treponema sp.]